MSRIIILFGFIAVVFTGLFVADLQGYFNMATRPVAFLKTSNGTVRRLADGQLTWDRALNGTLFGSGDTVSTGEGARARLVFYVGGEIELDAGAMVILGGSQEELKLNFISGTGKVRVAKTAVQKIKVVRGLPVKAVAAAKAKFEKTKQVATTEEPIQPEVIVAQNRIEVSVEEYLSPPVPDAAIEQKEVLLSEPVIALAPAVKEVDIRNPTKVMAAEPGEILTATKLPPAPQIKFPASDFVIDLSNKVIPKLEWFLPEEERGKDALKDASYEVTFRSADGGEDEKTLTTDQTTLSLLNRIGRGKYLWSVRAIAADGRRGPASVARWIEVRVPAQISRPIVLPVMIE